MKLDYLVAFFWLHHNVALMVGSVHLRNSYCMSVCMSVLLLLNTLHVDFVILSLKWRLHRKQSAVFSDSDDSHIMPQQIPL